MSPPGKLKPPPTCGYSIYDLSLRLCSGCGCGVNLSLPFSERQQRTRSASLVSSSVCAPHGRQVSPKQLQYYHYHWNWKLPDLCLFDYLFGLVCWLAMHWIDGGSAIKWLARCMRRQEHKFNHSHHQWKFGPRAF